MFTDIKPVCPFKIKLITAINNKDQSAVIQLIETGDRDGFMVAFHF